MCVIVLKPSLVEFNDADFKKCWERNSHGLGFISTAPEFHFQKGLMDKKKAIKATKKYRQKGVESVFHFRIQSKGGVSSALTHPFNFDKDNRKRFLFHNGTIHVLNPDNDQSDTKQAASWLSVLSDDDCDKLLKHWRSFGRFVTIIEDKNGKMNISVYEDKESVWKDGLWYSNTKHLDANCGRPTVGDGAFSCGERVYL